MKKFISTALAAVIISSTMVTTIATAAQRNVRSTRQAPRRRIIRKRNLPQATGKSSPRQVTQAAKQAERNAKKLQDDAQKIKDGKKTVSEKEVVADVKKVEADIKKIEQQLANLRSWAGDAAPGILGGGYSAADKQRAMDLAAPALKDAAILTERINRNKKAIEKITTKRLFGLASATVNPGKEQEYAHLNKLIQADENSLAKLQPIIAQQEIIMGTRLSTAVKSAYTAMAVAAMAVGIDLYTGGALSTAAAAQVSAVANSISYYTPSSIKWVGSGIYNMGAGGAAKLKAGLDYFRGTQPTVLSEEDQANASMTSQLIEAALQNEPADVNEESYFQTVILPGLQTLKVAAANEVKKTLFDAFKAGARYGTKTALSLLYDQVAALAGNPTADPAELARANEKLKAELARVKRTQNIK